MKLRTTAKAAALGVAAILALSACGSTSGNTVEDGQNGDLPEGVYISEDGSQAFKRNDPVRGGSLRVTYSFPTETIDPTAPVYNAPAAEAIFGLLFVSDKNGKVVPEMAESIETKDNGKTWTIKIPSGIKFTDGTDFNSEAIKFHFERLAQEGSRSGAAALMREIATISTPDATTLVVTLKDEMPTWPEVFIGTSTTASAMVPSPASIAEFGEQAGFHPVGAGAFMLKSYVSGGDAVLVRNPDYYIDDLPYLDELVIVQAVDEQARLAAVQAGSLDAGSSESSNDLRRATENGLVSVTSPAFLYWQLLFNLSKPPFDDLKFRQAVIQAVDYQAISDAMYDGRQPVMEGVFPKVHPFWIETDWPTFDPEAAKKSLADWQKDNPDQKPEFVLTIVSQPEVSQQSTIIQQMLEDVGIKMEISTSDQPTMITTGISGDYEAQHRRARINLATDSTVRQLFYTTAPFNHGKTADAEVDRLIDAAAMTTDEDEKKELYQDLQERLTEILPYMVIVEQATGWYLGPKVGGFPGARAGSDRPDYRLLYIAE